MVRVLFVCMGNICRSPTAEGVFRHKVAEAGLDEHIHIDSAGTHAYHVGKPPDVRAQNSARNRGFDLSKQRARRVTADDFEKFDYVIAMDSDNESDLRAVCPSGYEQRIHRFLTFSPSLTETDVPDPYYGGSNGFEKVLDLVEDAADGLLDHLRRNDRI
jgi:protein-tyrosine phosphatase